MGSNTGDVFGTERGMLKVFIGAAPGVGKTYTMLQEAVSLKERGIDVVIGYIDAHGRSETHAQIDGLEILPRKQLRVNGRRFEEVDLEHIMERQPAVVVIDELAHTNAPGSMFPKRYMDVEYLLDQGMSILTAVNIQHIEGIHEEAEEITGIRVRELIPQMFFKRANEMSVIDVTPETLRQRLRDGSIYSSDKINQALHNFFRKSNLSGLRELALRVVAEDVDERLERSYSRRKIPGPVGAKEMIMVCVSHYARAVKLIQRGHRMAIRMKADLFVLAISTTAEDLLSEREKSNLENLRKLAEQYDAEWVLEPRNDRRIGIVIQEMARQMNITQIVIGQPVRIRKWLQPFKDNPVRHLLRYLRYTDLRIVGWRDPLLMKSTGVQAERETSLHTAGKLTIYIGAAPGVGKTYKMLQDARDWKARGLDVVVGLVETHGRFETANQIRDLEVMSKKLTELDGRRYEELDVDAIVQRKPFIVIVDELAHTNVPGCARAKRYQDVEYLLEQGINVVTAVNIQHLESLHDKVEHITGVKVRERIPDWFMKMAREVKLIDVTSETLQQRLVEGRIYSRDKIERALDNFFQTANLAALRELALLEVANDVEQRINKVRDEEFERILVCVNHRPHSEKLIRRGWRLADRLKAELWVLVILTDQQMSEQDKRDLEALKTLSEEFDAHFIIKHASRQNVGPKIVEMADELKVSQLIAGQPGASNGTFSQMKTNPLVYVLDHAQFVDLHIVAHEVT